MRTSCGLDNHENNNCMTLETRYPERTIYADTFNGHLMKTLPQSIPSTLSFVFLPSTPFQKAYVCTAPRSSPCAAAEGLSSLTCQDQLPFHYQTPSFFPPVVRGCMEKRLHALIYPLVYAFTTKQ